MQSYRLTYRLREFVLVLLFFPLFLFSQKAEEQPNIVPNPGFEKFSGPPVGWFYKGAHFGQVVKYWFSASGASPDAYGPNIKVPSDWKEKGFGEETPHGGKAMAGLTVFGCENGKPHCREYIEILLAEPLVSGQTYAVEFWVNHIEKSLQVNNIGMLFSEKAIRFELDDPILYRPQFKATKIIAPKKGKWAKVSGSFQADVEGEYLLLGNFDTDDKTETQKPLDDSYNYAYYYFDDISVYKLPPYLPIPIKSDDLTLIELAEGKTITLKDIYFDFDKDELLPRSSVELKKLARIMADHPNMKIEIQGHTDSRGSETYNKVLSEKRAKSVQAFLLENEIPLQQIEAKGYGEKKPVESNKYEVGRQRNRRVTFKVLKI